MYNIYIYIYVYQYYIIYNIYGVWGGVEKGGAPANLHGIYSSLFNQLLNTMQLDDI